MYKNVGKRILAVFMSVCMLLGIADFSALTVRAGTIDLRTAILILKQDGEAVNYSSGLTYNGNKYDYEITAGGTPITDQVTTQILKNGNDVTDTGMKDAGDYVFKIFEKDDPTNVRSFSPIKISPVKLVKGNFTLEKSEIKIGDSLPPLNINEPLKSFLTGGLKDETKKQDYLLEYSGYNKVGTGQVTVKAGETGNCSVSTTIAFPFNVAGKVITGVIYQSGQTGPFYLGNINKYDLIEWNRNGDVVVNGENGETLSLEDYEIVKMSGDPTKPGKMVYEVRGKNDYQNAKFEVTYDIKKKIESWDDLTITGFNSSVVYSAQPVTQKILVKDGTYTLLENTDCKFEYDTDDLTNVGEKTFTIRFNGNDLQNSYYEGTIEKTFNITKASLSNTEVEVPDVEYVKGMDWLNNTEMQNKIKVTLNGVTVNPENYELSIVGENQNGAGRKTLKVTAAAGKNFEESSFKEKTFMINTQPLLKEKVVIDQQEIIYNDGKEIEAAVTVKDKANNVLVKDDDYTLLYSNNKAAGTGTVTVTGKGNYSGTVSQTFTIEQKDLTTIPNLSVEGIKDEITYTGYPINQDNNIIISYKTPDDTTIKLENNRDYTIEYTGDQTSVSSAGVSIKIVGKGNYRGTKEIGTFRIVPQAMDDTSNIQVSLKLPQNSGKIYTTPYTTQEIEPEVVVKHYQKDGWKTIDPVVTVNGSPVENYKVSFANNINKTTGTEKENLARVTITGSGNYTGENTELCFEITEMDLAMAENSNHVQLTLSSPSFTSKNDPFVPLQDTAVEPVFSLKYVVDENKTVSMSESADYEIVEYFDNTAPGIGKVRLRGKGNFKGEFVKEFTIKGNLQNLHLEAADQVYTGDPIELEDSDLKDATYEVEVDGKKVTKTLHLGTDFRLTYKESENNTNCGQVKAYVTTTEEENEFFYMSADADEKFVTFNIVPKTVADDSDNGIDIIPKYEENQVYTGLPIYPNLKITYNGHEMEPWNEETQQGDYKILTDADTRKNVNVTGTNEAFITIQGTGNNFTGTRKLPFTILQRDITDIETTQFITVPEELLYPEKADPEAKRIWTDQGEITIENPSFTYDGTTINGQPIHFDSGTGEAADGKMQEGRDYEISYKNNNQVGVATLVITGTGNFTGIVERNFNIWGDLDTYAENVQIDVHANKVYNGKKQVLGPDDITVKYFSQTIPFENYVITNNADAIGGDDINATKTHGAEDDVNARVHISISADAAELGEGQQNLFFGGKTGGDTIEETFAIAQRPIDDEEVIVRGIEEKGYTYTGNPIDPRKIAPTGDTKGFRLMFDGTELEEVKETQTTPPAGGDPSEGGDTGEGEETPPEVIVTGDYRVELVANTDVPEADASENEKPHFYIQAREDGNYSGTRMVHFTINPQSINAGDLHIRYRTVDANGVEKWNELDDKFSMFYEAKHQGREIRLENELDSFGIFYGDRQLYPKGSVDENHKLRRPDYEITYENNRKPGTATFILTAQGNYTDTKSIKFKIRGNLADAVIANIPAQPFNQEGVEPEIKVTYFGQELVAGEDYNIADYINNDQVTRANTKDLPAVIIQGIKDGGFEGTESSKQFNIIPRNLSIAENQVGMSLTGLADYYDYTGSPVEPDVAQLMLCYNGKAVKNGTNEFQFVRYGQNINGGNFEENGTNAPYIEITGTPYNPDIPGSGNYTGSMRFYFTIKGVSLEDRSTFTIEMEGTVPETGDQYYYTGSDINPTVIVRQEGRPEPLVEGEDYRLEYTGDLKTVGSNDATVIIKGINNYSDTRTAPFMIVGRDISAFPDEFSVYIPAQIYTGESIRPKAEDVIVTRLIGDEEITLEMDTDYILGNCENNINVGEGTIEVIGIGNYSGTVKAPFWIQPLDIDINDVMIEGVEDRVYNTLEQVQNVKVTWKGQMLPPNTYELSYSADHTNAGKASIIVTLLGNYSGSKAVDFTIASLPLTDSAISVSNIPNQVYSGKPITPALEITYQAPNQRASVKLVQNKDYRLTYTGNQEVGINTAKVTITGIGNYAGELQKTFTIIGSLAQAEVEAIPTQNYTGKEITPSPAVRLGGRTLEAGKDYTLAYANNIEAGKASITITGTGTEFGGSKVVNFDICRDVSAGLQVVGLVNAYLYTGTPVVPPLGKVTAYGKTLMPEKDYKVTVSNNINAGTASIQIEGIGYYKGSKTFQFNIVKRSIAQATVSKIATVNFNAKAQKPALTVKYGSTTLKEGTDYSLKYSNNKFPGKAIVMITGKGNMTGAKVVNFTIKMPSISGAAKATPSSTTKIKISWKKQSLASGYQIFDSKNKLIKTVKGGTKTSYTVSGLKAGRTYSFKVRYYNETDKRKCYSNFTKTVKTSTKPSTPKITLKSKKSKQATISWKKISGASGYEIYRSTKSKSGFKKIATTSKTSYTNTKLTSKKRYYYKVRAYRTVNGTKIYSTYSTTKYVTIK